MATSVIVCSKSGKLLSAVRDAESRACFLGVGVEQARLFAFMVSACMAGNAILLVEQCLDFVSELADSVHIMDPGEIAFSGAAADLENDSVRRHIVV